MKKRQGRRDLQGRHFQRLGVASPRNAINSYALKTSRCRAISNPGMVNTMPIQLPSRSIARRSDDAAMGRWAWRGQRQNIGRTGVSGGAMPLAVRRLQRGTYSPT